jgi:hypothetical protein
MATGFCCAVVHLLSPANAKLHLVEFRLDQHFSTCQILESTGNAAVANRTGRVRSPPLRQPVKPGEQVLYSRSVPCAST